MESSYAIREIHAEEILDSRGNPTLSVTVATKNSRATFGVPAGASTGKHEAKELRDGDKRRFRGLGVTRAVRNVNTVIRRKLIGKDVGNQAEIDALLCKLDGTPDKRRLGANALIGVSIACAKAAAAASGTKPYKLLAKNSGTKPHTPLLYLNLINAGKHASSYLAFQEYMIVPLTDSVERALVMADAIRAELKREVIKRYGPFSGNYGDEGGFVIHGKKVAEPLEILTRIITKLKLRGKVMLAIDAAADSFYANGKYAVDGKKLTAGQLLALYESLIRKYPMISIEDPFYEDDFSSFAKLLKRNPKIKVIGDDLTVTNPKRFARALKEKSISGIIIKPNQIGTLSESLEVMRMANRNRISCVVSHRSGETNDDFIADLAYAFGTFGLKAGAPNRGERLAKYNRLWEISEKS
ncbi:MAG: phosphopyruvate hydratase [Patescibacteria group bacterium]|nr:phosphopyruvate hydratase [Patescibacteria group bacterium]